MQMKLWRKKGEQLQEDSDSSIYNIHKIMLQMIYSTTIAMAYK